jgi:hypothetical protein
MVARFRHDNLMPSLFRIATTDLVKAAASGHFSRATHRFDRLSHSHKIAKVCNGRSVHIRLRLTRGLRLAIRSARLPAVLIPIKVAPDQEQMK